jgi:hypothetical protein
MLALSALIGAAWRGGRLLAGAPAGCFDRRFDRGGIGRPFRLAYLFAPRKGLLAAPRRRRRQREEFALAMLAGHLLNHEDDRGAFL